MQRNDQASALNKGDSAILGDAAVLTRLDKAVAWARKFSIFRTRSQPRAVRWSICRFRPRRTISIVSVRCCLALRRGKPTC